MAIVIEQSLATAVDTPSGSATSSSWTPGSNELCLCLMAFKGSNTPSNYAGNVTGNGLTWVNVLTRDDTQGQVCLSVWRAMGSSPSAGGVTVTLTVDPTSCSFQLIRISGVKTSGTNGSDAIGATATADTGATDTTAPSTSVTTTAANSRVIGFGAGRGQAYTVGSGFTAILINQIASTAGNQARSSTEYKDVASSGTNTTVDFSTGSATDWAIAAIELLIDSGTTYTQTLSGTLTSAGAIVKKPVKVLTGTLTSAGTLLRKLTRALAGTLTSSGALTALKLTVKTLAGTLTSSGALVKKPIKSLGGTLTSGGTLIRKVVKVLTGTLTSSGALTKAKVVIKTLAGTLTSSGTLIKRTTKTLTSTLTSSGILQAIVPTLIRLTVAARRTVLTVATRLRALTIRNKDER